MTVGSCIIVGGGPAGIHVAKSIAKFSKGSVDVTIVDRQDYMDWSLASPRSLAKPSDIEQKGYVMPLKSVVKHIDQYGSTTFVQGSVQKIGPKAVTLEGGEMLEADTIVIAVGGKYIFMRGHQKLTMMSCVLTNSPSLYSSIFRSLCLRCHLETAARPNDQGSPYCCV